MDMKNMKKTMAENRVGMSLSVTVKIAVKPKSGKTSEESFMFIEFESRKAKPHMLIPSVYPTNS